jgi:hypothetical protein
VSPIRGFSVLVAVSLISVSVAATASSVDRPSWTPGDFWTYRTNTTLTEGFTLNGTATSTVSDRQPTTTASGSVNAFRILLTGLGTASGAVTTPNGTISFHGQWTLTGEERLEPANLRPVYDLVDLSVNGTYLYGVPIPFTLRFQNTTTFDVLEDGWPYPMMVGMSGNVTEAYNFTQDLYSPTVGHLHQNGTGLRTLRFTLTDAVSLETPAGTFAAYPLRQDSADGSWQRLFVSLAVGNDVRTESYDAGGHLTAVTTLLAYRYQALEPAAFLGLSLIEWLGFTAAVAAIVIVALILVRRHRKKKSPPIPNGAGATEPTSGPRGP